jgi:hypothetical protein
MAILTVKQLQSELEYQRVFEEYERISSAGQDFNYCKLVVRSDGRDKPNVTFLMDEKCTTIEYFSIGSWDDELFFGSHEVEDAVRLAKQFVYQKICVTEVLGAAGKYCGSDLTRPNEPPLSLDKEVTHLRRCLFGKEPLTESADLSRYVFDEAFQIFIEKNFVSKRERQREIDGRNLLLGDERDRRILSYLGK